MYTKKVTRRNPETGIVETVSVPMTTEETLARQAEEDQATIDAAAQEISDKLSGIKDEAERRILAILDKNKQRNLLAHGLEAIFEHGPDPAQWPAADRALQQDTTPKWRQIKAIRAASDALEAMNPIPANYTDDIHWP